MSLFSLASALSSLNVPPARANGPRAGLVVQHGDGSVRTFCVDLGAAEISGEELLQRSGVDFVGESTALGVQVCRIGPDGCDFPAAACWCHCADAGAAGCTYWGYNLLRGDRWEFSALGPQARILRDGDVDGWAWGPGTVARGAAPPVRRFAEICGAGTEEATAPPTPPPGTATGRPTAGPRPSPTPRPTLERPPSPTPRPSRPPPPTISRAAARPAAADPSATPSSGPPGAGYPPPAGTGRAPFDSAAETSVAQLFAGLSPSPPGPSPATTATSTPPPAAGTATLAAEPTSTGTPSALGAAGGRAWSGYLAFAVLAAGLGGAWLWLRRRGGRAPS